MLAERAVEAYRAYGDPDGYAQAVNAELLLRLGREDEAMAELTALRPLLSEDASAVSYISEVLERGGRPEIAEQWLTAALHPVLQRRDSDPTDPQIRQGYAQHLAEHPRETAWPPGRNHDCWCGSA